MKDVHYRVHSVKTVDDDLQAQVSMCAFDAPTTHEHAREFLGTYISPFTISVSLEQPEPFAALNRVIQGYKVDMKLNEPLGTHAKRVSQ